MSSGFPPALRSLPVGRFTWRSAERKTIYLCAALLSLALFFFIVYASKTWHSFLDQTQDHPAPFGDFFALWSYAEVLAKFPAVELYHSAALHQLQVAWGMDPVGTNPFPYPPLFMPLVRVLNILPYTVSYLVWVGGTLALLLWVVFATCSRSVWGLVAIALAPATTATIASGQSGLLVAALMTLSLRLAPSRPVWAGLALGVLACKPQLAVLIPVALAASGVWIALVSAAATAVGLGVLASLLYGWDIWPAWLAMLPGYNAAFVNQTGHLREQPTLLATLQTLGCPTTIATIAQMAALGLVAFVVWRLCRLEQDDIAFAQPSCSRRLFDRVIQTSGDSASGHHAPAPGAVPAAAVIVGTFVATPHALIYDMPVVTVAMLLFIQDRLRRGEAFATAEVASMSAVALLPVYMTLTAKPAWVPIAWLCLALLFTVLARAAFRDASVPPRR